VVVIGGGITGAGILRDLAMRGIEAVLVEKGDLAHGTSARFHGLLHSGARYAVTDPASAQECIRENLIQKKTAAHCIEDTVGVFIQLAEDDPCFVAQWQKACGDTGIDIKEIDCAELLKREPNLSPVIIRAFQVPDAAVDGFKLIQDNVLAAKQYGAKVLTYGQAVSLAVSSGRVCGVTVRRPSGDEEFISCQIIVNAAGPWTGEIAALAGLKLNLVLNKGTLLAFNHRLTNTIINRCRRPGDGDILVPHHTVSIYGTTSVNVTEPDTDAGVYEEVGRLLALGRQMIPLMEEARILRAFTGVRPLYQPDGEPGDGMGREVTRDFFVIDHEEEDGLSGLVSIVGGKFTTYRLMAERTVNLVAEKLGNKAPCRTAGEVLPGSRCQREERPAPDQENQVICECEQVTEKQLEQAMGGEGWFTLNDLRRKTRMGMGTCQGTFCTYRALAVAQKDQNRMHLNTLGLVQDLLGERWKGMQPVLWGPGVKEAELMRAVYSDILDMEGLDAQDE